MRDSFSDATLLELLEGIRATHALLPFADVPTAPGSYAILRHDVDYSPEAALRLARLEASRGIRATYFVLPGSLYYSVLAPEHALLARDLRALGHEVGLHYDMDTLRAFPPSERSAVLMAQIGLLETISGVKVKTIAMHQTGLHSGPRPEPPPGVLDAHAETFCRDIPYVSDSCRAWTDVASRVLASRPLPARFQLVVHPENWGPVDRDRASIYEGLHAELRYRVSLAGATLLARIAEHPGVREHEARFSRAEA
jgi:hypothetical protein